MELTNYTHIYEYDDRVYLKEIFKQHQVKNEHLNRQRVYRKSLTIAKMHDMCVYMVSTSTNRIRFPKLEFLFTRKNYFFFVKMFSRTKNSYFLPYNL